MPSSVCRACQELKVHPIDISASELSSALKSIVALGASGVATFTNLHDVFSALAPAFPWVQPLGLENAVGELVCLSGHIKQFFRRRQSGIMVGQSIEEHEIQKSALMIFFRSAAPRRGRSLLSSRIDSIRTECCIKSSVCLCWVIPSL